MPDPTREPETAPPDPIAQLRARVQAANTLLTRALTVLKACDMALDIEGNDGVTDEARRLVDDLRGRIHAYREAVSP